MKIATIAPLHYTPAALEYFCFLRGGVGADYHQNPEFQLLADDELLLYWGAYDFDECSNNSVNLYCVSRDRGETWTDVQVYLADFPGGIPTAKIVGLADSNDAVMIQTGTYHDEIGIDPQRRIRTKGSNYFLSRTRAVVRRSSDGGNTFEQGTELPYALITGGPGIPDVGWYGSTDELIQLGSGRLVAAFMYLDPLRSNLTNQVQHFSVACLLSDDGGSSWRSGGRIASDTTRGVMEVQIVETTPGRLFCLFRTKAGCLYQTTSQDSGESWDPVGPSPLPAPESMARMIKLRSGSLLVVWNNVSSATQHPRYPLVAAVSLDGGGSWTEPRVLATESGTNQLSNHAMIELQDGRILVAISHYRSVPPMTSDLDMAVFDEKWLRGE